jgi:hypothetical protein
MSISGTLETFSLPELFRLIDSGSKSGRLIFQSLPDPNEPESQRLYHLWFQKGRLVTISDRLNPQSLIALIESRGWVDKKITAQLDLSDLSEQPLGAYLEKIKLLTSDQRITLFLYHLHQVYRLFECSAAWFQFDEISDGSEVDGLKTMPWLEMTGKSIRAAEVVLHALRSQKNWDIFAEQLPEPGYALQKLVAQPELQLVPLEWQIWEMADGKVSLKAIANKINESLLHVQRAAFRLIMAGLADEIPIASSSFSSAKPSDRPLTSPPLQSVTNASAQTATENQQAYEKPGVSTSLLQNLINFLRRKFW